MNSIWKILNVTSISIWFYLKTFIANSSCLHSLLCLVCVFVFLSSEVIEIEIFILLQKNSKSRWIAKCTLQPTYTFRFNLIILVFFWTNIGRRKRFCINFLKLNFQSSFSFILSPLGCYKRSNGQHAYWSEKFTQSSGQ